MTKFKFSVGPWNVHSGVDSYGPATRNEIDFEEKIRKFAELGFSAIQFHDDDAVPNINDYTEEEIKEKARELKRMLDKYGLAAEFVAPRLWMVGRTADGGFMSTSQEDREYAMWRAYRSIDIAKELGCNMVVLWLAREGTLCAESKSPVWATKMLIHAINKMLEYDSDIRICIEPKPNEPIDRSICGTMGHVLAVSAATIDPKRVGGNLESAHAILAGLDPAHEIGFAMAMGKLMTVHLNDQNGIKYDQDKAFGVENLRSAFNQVKVLKENGYGENGEYVGLDVKAMRTTRDEDSYKHLENSLNIFKALEEKADRFDYEFQKKCVKNRDFEAIKGAHLFHFGYPTLMRRMYQNQGEELARMFRRIKEGGTAISLDMAAIDPSSEAAREDWKGILEKVLPYVDFFVPSAEELCFMLDRERYQEWSKRAEGRDITEVIRVRDVKPLGQTVLDMGAGGVLIKCGAPGIYYRTASGKRIEDLCRKLNLSMESWKDKEGFEPSFEPDAVVSGTGAGDAA